MNAALALRLIVDPTLAWLATLGVRSDDRARVMLLAIAGQESGFRERIQVPNGPARSLWQFERGGGVRGVLTHPVSTHKAKAACLLLLVTPTEAAVHEAMAQNDALACTMARLLLLTDPKPLPGLDQSDAGWAYYLRNWRPGKPHPEKWVGNWRTAVAAVAEAPPLVAERVA